MGWLEGILEFLRHGPGGGGKLDMNALFQAGLDSGTIDKSKAIREINSLIKWQTARKKWHQDKTRQKMASGGGDEPGDIMGGMGGFKTSDFGLNEVSPFPLPSTFLPPPFLLILTLIPQLDLQDLELDDDGDDEDDEESDDDDDVADPIEAERKRRAKTAEKLRRKAGEPLKPPIEQLLMLHPSFVTMLRSVLSH